MPTTDYNRLSYRQPSGNQPLLRPLADVADKSVDWLWPGRLAGSKVSLLVGPAGVGKSLLALDIAARVTTGRPWPNESANQPPRKPASVLILSEADDVGDTIRPRLAALGADLHRVAVLREIERGGPQAGTKTLFSIDGTFEMLTSSIRSLGNCRLLVIDPLSAYLESSHQDRQFLLANLTELAQRYQLAILLINRIPQFAEAARAVWSLVPDRQLRERRLLLPIKNNLAPDHPGLALRIVPNDKFNVPRIEWERDALSMATEIEDQSPAAPRLRPLTQRETATAWLVKQLRDGPRFSQELIAAARREEIAERTLRRALHDLRGMARKGSTGLWLWMLPDLQAEECSATNIVETNQLGQENSLGKHGQVGKVGQHGFCVA